jgi:hypothetical protein
LEFENARLRNSASDLTLDKLILKEAAREDEKQLTDDLVALVREHVRLGYRKMAALLRSTSGWVVNDQAGGADLAAGGSEGPAPAAEAEPDLAR